MARRYYVALTEAQREAVIEALAFRLAGEVGGDAAQRVETYEAAERAVHQAQSADVALLLSKAEARGLVALVSEGAEGLLTDEGAARGYIGGPSAVAAAMRARDKLEEAT